MLIILKTKGLTLIEVLVTLAITTVGLLGLSAMQFQSVQAVQDSGNRSHAIWVVNDLINRMRANEVTNYQIDSPINCQSAPEKTCSAYHDGTSRIAASTDCTGEELATADIWEAVCGTPLSTGFSKAINSSSSLINDPLITIEELDNGDKQLTISWASGVSGVSGVSGSEQQKYMTEDGELIANQRDSYTTVFRP